MIRRAVLTVLTLLALAAPASAQPTRVDRFPGKVRIASTAADALCIGAATVSPASTSCTGGIYAGQIVSTVSTNVVGLAAVQTGTSDFSGLRIQRTGGTASDWQFYLPTASTDLRFYNGGDRFSLSSAGALSLVASQYHLIGANKWAYSNGTNNYAFSGSSAFIINNAADSASILTLTNAGVLTVAGAGNHTITGGVNGDQFLRVLNTTTGTGADGGFQFGADNSLSASLVTYSTSYSSSGLAGITRLQSSASGGLRLQTLAGAVEVWTNSAARLAVGYTNGTVQVNTTIFDNTNYRLISHGNTTSVSEVIMGAVDLNGVYTFYSLGNGDGYFGRNLQVFGALSKGSGTFQIDHPLDRLARSTDLFHGFVEAPRYDLVYRGRATLAHGAATASIDAASRMTAGTFAALTQNAQAWITPVGGVTVTGTVVGGNVVLTAASPVDGEASWLVIAERADNFIKHGGTAVDSRGRLVPEQPKPEGTMPGSKGTLRYPAAGGGR